MQQVKTLSTSAGQVPKEFQDELKKHKYELFLINTRLKPSKKETPANFREA